MEIGNFLPLPPFWPPPHHYPASQPVSDDYDFCYLFIFHDEILPDVAPVSPRTFASSNGFGSSSLPRNWRRIMIGIQDQNRESHRLSLANKRQLSSAIQTIVDYQATGPLPRSNLKRGGGIVFSGEKQLFKRLCPSVGPSVRNALTKNGEIGRI